MFELGIDSNSPLHGKVYAWYGLTSDFNAQEFESCLQILSPEEKERHSKLLSMPDADAYALSHALLHHALSCFSSVNPGEWRFSRNSNGKPFIDPRFQGNNTEGNELFYSLSHCKSACAVLVSDIELCGIDIENTEREGNYLELAAKMFPDEELAVLKQSTDIKQDFFHLWTMREACVKAMGTGLANSKDFFSLGFDTENTFYQDRVKNLNDDRWQLRYFEKHQHATAIAIRSENQLEIQAIELKS